MPVPPPLAGRLPPIATRGTRDVDRSAGGTAATATECGDLRIGSHSRSTSTYPTIRGQGIGTISPAHTSSGAARTAGGGARSATCCSVDGDGRGGHGGGEADEAGHEATATASATCRQVACRGGRGGSAAAATADELEPHLADVGGPGPRLTGGEGGDAPNGVEGLDLLAAVHLEGG